MEKLEIRKFDNKDAVAIANIIRRNILEVLIKDYSSEEMESLSKVYDSDKVLKVTSYAHMYVVCIDDEIVGCGAISSFWGKRDESILLSIYVIPELHNKGIGRKIIETLEWDEYFIRAKRIEIPASITACEFYRKMGYDYKYGIKELDEEGHYRLEKFR
jgi:GNAT superfamily N-acetyltransferase